MSEARRGKAAVVPKAVIAAVVGSLAGGTVGVWSLPRPTASMDTAAPGRAAWPARAPAATAASPMQDAGVAVAPQSAPAPPADDAEVLQRARTLASRPDVMGLMALRDDVFRRASERGIAGSPSIKGELDELDQRLNEARMLRLKLDAEEFRKADSR